MIKMLTLTLMPIIVLTALAISDLIATLNKSVDASEIRRNVRFSRQVSGDVMYFDKDHRVSSIVWSWRALPPSIPVAQKYIILVLYCRYKFVVGLRLRLYTIPIAVWL